MTVSADLPRRDDERDLALRRARLDVEDLRYENDRLRASVEEKQSEVLALSERLAELQARLDRYHRVTAWSGHLWRLAPLRILLRRRR